MPGDRPPPHWSLLVIVLLLGVTGLAHARMAWTFVDLERQGTILVQPGIPNGLQDLSLSLSERSARKVLGAWGDRLREARRTVEIDNRFIPHYALFFVLLATFVVSWAYLDAHALDRAATPSRWPWPWMHWLALLAAVAAIVHVDIRENEHLLRLLAGQLDHLALARLLTQLKLTVLLLFFLGILLAVGLGIRRTWRHLESARRRTLGGTAPPASTAAAASSRATFADLVEREYAEILAARRSSPAPKPQTCIETAKERWVNPSGETFVGLALSGGGIRSATFNLGLLQGLHRLDLLRHVDYVATVSGGGYIGGFWSKWLQQRAAAGIADTVTFPDEFKKSTANPANDTRIFESTEVRHIREFGNFLSPRSGLFDTESWGGAVVFLAALVPALLAALSVLGLSLVVWFTLTFYLACLSPWGGALFIGLVTLAGLLGLEWWWRADATAADRVRSSLVRVVATSVAAGAAVGGLHALGRGIVASIPRWPWRVGVYEQAAWASGWVWTEIPRGYEGWWALVGFTSKGGWIVSPGLYEPSLAWGAIALALLLLRFRGAFAQPSMSRRVSLPTADRTTMRLLAFALLWAVVATFWHLGLNFANATAALLTAAGAGGGLFALLRNWIGGLAQQPKGSIWDRVKPYVPTVLAYLTVGLAWAGVSSALSSYGGQDWFRWYQAAAAMAVVTVAILLVDPAEFGLHAIYRDRICRAYLGAARPGLDPADNRGTDLHADDDVRLDALPARPLQLVCCAANDLDGDPVETLSRGARSAVLSRHGVALGDDWASGSTVTLGSALTASAAAFNSNMGAVSMEVGPAVAFLMSSLNLRLGLWVANPRSPSAVSRRLPGALYYKEMFSLSGASGREVHLSDGAHFDNLALYELVRRHCRYIIVSDCTADRAIAFDDFGRTARRIREDFGVEIDIDLDALRPGPDRLARQYAVVGSIDYGWFDRGVLVYVKPGLTGREPVDIRQYKAGNDAFPHESTVDQFYDEAQWESYRRLGVLAAREVFQLVEHLGPAARADGLDRAQAAFETARQVWYPTPAGLAERILEMSDRFGLMENEIKRDASVSLLAEVFPEVTHLGLRPPAPGRLSEDLELGNLGCLLRVTQIMEDAILACRLETHWSHPLNHGWVNTFARWATAPTFLAWWPFIRPMYGPSLRTFLEERFPVVGDAARLSGPVTLLRDIERPGLAMTWWRDRGQLKLQAGQLLYEFRVALPARNGVPRVELQLALVALKLAGTTALWTSNDFFVPPSLWGGGFGGRFLDELFTTLRGRHVTTCKVTVEGPGEHASRVQWEERRNFVDFYRRNGFQIVEPESNNAKAVLSKNI